MGDGKDSVLRLTLPSRMEELSAIPELIAKAKEKFDLSEELAHWIELSVSESTINAIQHGNGLDPSKKVFVSIACDGQALEIVVEDQGSGFDLKDVPDPTETENLMKPGGRGILIIKSFMDTVELTGGNDGVGSRLRMVKRLEQERPA